MEQETELEDSSWGDGELEPTMVYMSVRAYWQLRWQFERPRPKLPRKMKKLYIGTKARNKRKFKMRRMHFDVHVEKVSLGHANP